MMTLNLRDSFSATKHQHFRPFTISKLYIIKAVVGVGRVRRPILFCHSVYVIVLGQNFSTAVL